MKKENDPGAFELDTRCIRIRISIERAYFRWVNA